MQTNLAQQKLVVEQIQKAPSVPTAIQLLRGWLRDYYEQDMPCDHATVFRVTGICTRCGEKVQ